MIFLYDGINIEGNGGVDPSATFTGDPVPLLDAIDCVVTEERNGQFSLVMRYPINAEYSNRIVPDAIIMASPRPNADAEPFRIYEIEQVITGVVTARAYHLVYDLDGLSIGLPANAFSGKQGITAVLNQLATSGQFASRCFELANDGITDTTTTLDFGDAKWCSVWKTIGIIAAAFNAEMKYTWDGSTNRCAITFCAARGTAKNTEISYGKNIISLDRKLDYSGLYSRVAACWFGNGTFFQGHANTGYTGRVRTLWIDVTDQFPSQPTPPQLDDAAQAYIDSHDFSPSSDLAVDFVPIAETDENLLGARVGYAAVGESIIGDVNLFATDTLYLCDTATVDASFIGVTATAKCVGVAYNVITEKYDKVTVGTIQNDIVDTILKLEG